MHYVHPFTISQVDSLRYWAMSIVAARLRRAEPPLRKEVVEYMLNVDSHMWSMRRSRPISSASCLCSLAPLAPLEESDHNPARACLVSNTDMLPGANPADHVSIHVSYRVI
ncbi:hypothetical protein Cni_G10508 [Canna indica]|uniref:Uncharacterized protein n=1 Tax=Canna indica TaxID=4628 RepID=A0AAQ3Q7D8_9LILI|nr:hypothetical protein Cni_G10508 [Canna indica]